VGIITCRLLLIKIQIGLTFLRLLTQVVLQKRLLNECLFYAFLICSSLEIVGVCTIIPLATRICFVYEFAWHFLSRLWDKKWFIGFLG